MTTEPDRLRALAAANELLLPGGRLVFDVFAPSSEDVEDTHGRWLEREPGIFERADWDEGERTLTLSVRRGEEASTMLLAWLSPPEWRLLLDRAGFDVDAQWGWFDRRPYAGGEDVVFSGTRTRLGYAHALDHPRRRRVLVLVAGHCSTTGSSRLRNRVENAWAQVDVQLKRRYDLIPNLVETVKGYAAHERETFEAVTAARTRAQAAQGPAEQGAAEGILGQALGRLFAVAEAYPELQADENFRQLQDELAQTENRIAVSRQVYNDTVLTYNTAIQTVPGVFFAGPVRLLEEGLLRGGGRGPGGATRRVLAVAVLAALVLAGDAAAKSFTLPAADVVVQVGSDGSLIVDEVIAFDFAGDFSGAFREIPLRDGRDARPGGGLGGGRRSTARAHPPSSAPPALRGRSGRRRPTRAYGSSGTSGRCRSSEASASTTGCAESRSPTTTWST